MIKICKDRCMIINKYECENNSLGIVFMIPGNRFLKGIIEPDLLAHAGEISLFYWADIEFVDSDDEEATLEILKLRMDQPAESNEPAF